MTPCSAKFLPTQITSKRIFTPRKINTHYQLRPRQTVQLQLKFCHPNALQTFILTVHIDIDYCHFYYFLLYNLRFDSLILSEDDDDDDDDDDAIIALIDFTKRSPLPVS